MSFNYKQSLVRIHSAKSDYYKVVGGIALGENLDDYSEKIGGKLVDIYA
jgi:hypothetical protein